MTDSTLNSFLARGTSTQRGAFTPSPPSPASGPSPTYIWHETDTGDTYAYNGTSWDKINTSAATITSAAGMMALDGLDGEEGMPIPGPAGAAAIGGAGALTLISKVTPSGTPTVTFSGIPQTYTHLLLMVSGRSAAVAVSDNAFLTFNSDTGANYDLQYTQAGNTSLSSGQVLASTNLSVALLAAASATAGYTGFGRAEIFNYADATFNKMLEIAASFQSSTIASGLVQRMAFGGWRSTAAINRIDLTLAGNWVAGSVVSLYGRS